MAVALTHLAGRSVGVFGLARSGLATVRAAVAGGAAEVAVWDDKPEAREEASALGGRALTPAVWPWADLDSLVLAPGVPFTHPEPHPVVAQAREAAVEIISDIELLWREARGRGIRFVGITGTNGKSTTAALLGHILRECDLKTSVGGNIGRAALDLEPLEEGRIYVLELSSYQLDLTRRFRPDVAVWLNLTPDHLDRHGSMSGYAKAKARIFLNMSEDDVALAGIDEPEMQVVTRAIQYQGRPRLITVSVGKHGDASLYVDVDGELYENGQEVASFDGLPNLRGVHNWQNAAMAWGAATALGLEGPTVLRAMASFPGLAHRMELVGRRGSVFFVNDSKATNADAAAHALAAYDVIYWIAGGRPKEGGIEPLAEYFPKITKAYLIGEAAEAFSATLARRVPHVIAGDLDTAVRMAADDAAIDRRKEPTVLLSPACASFDQYKDFEARGDAFRRAVNQLDETRKETAA